MQYERKYALVNIARVREGMVVSCEPQVMDLNLMAFTDRVEFECYLEGCEGRKQFTVISLNVPQHVKYDAEVTSIVVKETPQELMELLD